MSGGARAWNAADAAARLAGLERAFVPATADALLAEAAASGAPPETIARWIDELPPSIAGRYVQASYYGSCGRHADAARCWNDFLERFPTREPLLLAQSARALAAAADWDGAARRMREALSARPTYTVFARMQRAVDDIAAHARDTVREARIAVLGSATTSLLIPLLRALAFRDRIGAEFHEGAFGAFRQEILDPAGPLAAFRPTIAIVAPNWRDLELPALGDGEAGAIVTRIVREYRMLWASLASRGCQVVQQTFDLPADDSAGLLATHVSAARRRLIRRINLALGDELPSGVSLLDTEQIAAQVGLDRWSNARLWHLARQHPASDALPELAEEQMAHVRAVLGLSRKVLVCDLDNTLWKGVIGEDGLDGIKVGPGSPEGEAFADFQRYIRELRQRGVVLAVCSKNNPADAQLPFENRRGMVLRRDDFAVFAANWDDKATNVRRIAAAIGVGLDSLVVVDDNPFERAWLRSQLPEVAVPELGPSVFTYVRDLDRGRHFPSVAWSPEDRLRADAYRQEQAREAERAGAANLDEFLAGLHMKGTCVPVADGNIERVAQLTNKTNQFNLTTRRRTVADVRQLAAAGWTGVFSLRDRYGDYGIIGVMFCIPGPGPDCWSIDTWLMSCRVLRRDVEKFMLDCAVEAARAAGVARLRGRYVRTEKNGQVADLLPGLGFTTVARSEAEGDYELRVESVASPFNRVIAREGDAILARK